MQLVATIISSRFVDKSGRRLPILLGIILIGIINILISVVFYLQNKYEWTPGFTFGMLLIFIVNIVFGLTLGPVVWLYIPEIVPPKVVPLATAMYWFGCAFCIIVAPIITHTVNSIYLVFFILGVYLLVIFVPNYFLAIQTKSMNP